MNYETAKQAAKAKIPVVFRTFKQPGLINRVELGSGDNYIARFTPDDQTDSSWAWVSIAELDLAEVSEATADSEPVDDGHFSGMSIRDIVETIRRSPNTAENPFVDALVKEVHHRLEAIQIYQGTEAVIIRMILAGRRPTS